MSDLDDIYMRRCIQLALLGEGEVAPNPMVGAVLVHENQIIGEGYHQKYGQAHAEVNCISNVSDRDRQLIPLSTLYVSLEPCAHFGKTPPCSDLIIQNGIRKVVIGCRDPFPEVDGKGIAKLLNAGIEVITGVLEEACLALNKRFFCFHQKHRAWIVLKWAQTSNGKIAGSADERLLISNETTNRLVHQWRSAEAAILVGTNTALKDDPALDNRFYSGPSPVRMLLDLNLRLPATLQLFNGKQKTIVFNLLKGTETDGLVYYKLRGNKNIPQQIAEACYAMGIQSVLVEGGAQLLDSFIGNGLWDEARIITNKTMIVNAGLSAPMIGGDPVQTKQLHSDTINYFTNYKP